METVRRDFKVCILDSTGDIKQTIPFSDGLHLDDSISTIKMKILRQIGIDIASYKELYLFALLEERLSIIDMYKQITANGELFTHDVLLRVFNNVKMASLPASRGPDYVYTYEDIVGLYNNESIFRSIGRKYKKNEDYLFSVNPFKCIDSGDRHTFYSLDNITLLNVGSIIDYTLYVCLASDVFEYANSKGIDNDYIAEMYYPFLFASGITSGPLLLAKKQELLYESKNAMSDDMWKLYETVDMFHQIYNNRTPNSNFKYESSGILSFDIGIKTEFNVFPLDSLFKSLHADKEFQFIKYNPGFRKENLYRLHSDHISSKNRRMPSLSIPEIIRLSKETGKSSEISLYSRVDFKGSAIELYIDFMKDGSVRIHSKLPSPITREDLHQLLDICVNPLIDNINGFVEHIGYRVQRYTSLNDKQIDIYNIEYGYSLSLTHSIKLDVYRKGISSIFAIENTDVTRKIGDKLVGAKMRFKRVDNYQEMDDIDEYISTEKAKYGDIAGLIGAMISEFGIEEEKARDRMILFAKKYTDTHKGENSGIPVFMKLITSEKRLQITISKMTAVEYIDIIMMYIDSILRIFQNPGSCGVPIATIQTICKRTINFEEVERRKFEPPPPQQDREDEVDIDRERERDRDRENDDVQLDEDFFKNVNLEEDERDRDRDRDNETDEIGMDYDETDFEGGAKPEDELLDVNMDGLKLKNPNPMQARIEELDGDLVLKSQQGKYRPFSRTCRAEVNLQPVALSEADKERIDREHPGSYTTAIKTGSKPDKQHWYICPRYWSLKTKSSLTQEEVDEILKTQPNAVIPHKATVVPKGAFIYEIAHPKEHFNENGEYIPHYPGLITDSHPDGYDIPCCRRRPPKETVAVEESTKQPAPVVNTNVNTYVVDANKYPIQHNRWGFMPLPAQMFFQTDSSKCVSKTNTAIIKHNKPCLLRYGVEHSILQSIVGCFADIYASENGIKKTPTIAEMRDIILGAITFDIFLEYHNSSLTAIFRPPSDYHVRDMSAYEESDFAQFIDVNNENEVKLRDNLIGAYENFRRYLSYDNTHIDHTFMWDIISRPNPKLLKKGANLVVIQLTKDSDYVDLICPPNAYASQLYDSKKGTFILLKQDVFYEPVYLYENRDGPHDIKLFYKHKSDPLMQTILTRIENLTTKYCKPKNSMPKEYTYERSISLEDVISILQRHGYIVKEQVINYQMKTIGVYASFGVDFIFIPCRPSPATHELVLTFMDDDRIASTYEHTKQMLLNVYQKTNGEIKCRPVHKVVDKSQIIGFITETNQFVKINTPADVYKTVDEIPIVYGNDYIVADKSVTMRDDPDPERVSTVRNIYLESQFYRVFRSTIRVLLGYYENRKIKLDIIGILENPVYKYNQKLQRIDKLLRDMSRQDIVFDKVEMEHVKDITSCITSCDTKPHCVTKADGKCALKIPKENLLTKRDNSIIYYGKLSDELVRFHRIRAFMLEPKNYLNLSNTNYTVNDDEILLLDSTLNSDYFNDMNIFDVNDYITNLTYDTAEPEAVTQHYSNVEEMV